VAAGAARRRGRRRTCWVAASIPQFQSPSGQSDEISAAGEREREAVGWLQSSAHSTATASGEEWGWRRRATELESEEGALPLPLPLTMVRAPAHGHHQQIE
jgi:hypothetical protein